MKYIEKNSIPNCVSTMVFGIAQDDDVDLILTGFNDRTYIDVYHIVLELIEEFGDVTLDNYSILDSIDEKLKTKIYEIRLKNLENIIDYIKVLPDSEIFKLLASLISLTSIKIEFSPEVHSVGGKQSMVVLRKYREVSIIE